LKAVPIDQNKAFGVVDRERVQNELIDKGVDGGRRSNAKSKRQHGGGREPWITANDLAEKRRS